MQVKLVVVGDTTKNQEIRLRLPTTIGRGRMCTLQLPHPLVSRQHCEIFVEAGKLKVRDLGSLNGTFVNGQKCTVTSLPAGSMLVVGTVTFRVVYDTTEGLPDILAREIVEELEAALAQFAGISEELGGDDG